MMKCNRCGNSTFPRNKCTCNFVSPNQSQNRERGDTSKWCPVCSCRVINGKCTNAKCGAQ
jgi:hypothetical protein